MNFKDEIKNMLKTKISVLSDKKISELIEIPKNAQMGDFAFPCFQLAKEYRKSPMQIAEEIASELSTNEFIPKIENTAGYINFFINKETFIKNTLTNVLENENYGDSNVGEGKTIVVEYSSPNIAKPFHIGHLRTTMIGNSINNLLKAVGYNTVSVNHLGDFGKQFGLLITAFKLWGDRDIIEKDPINELLKLYVRINKEKADNPSLDDEARAWFKKLEDGNAEAVELWKFFREVSLIEFNRVYDLLGVTFDSYAGESFYSDKMPAVLEELREKNLVEVDNGAEIVNFEKHNINLPVSLITKSDGSSLYTTRDIAAAIYRKKTYDFHKNLYIVGSEQCLHFDQWIAVLKLMDRDFADDCIHIPYGLVSLEEGKLSTRAGNMLKLEDVLNKSIEKTLSIINDKNPNLENKEEVAKQVGIGAIIFQDLYHNKVKNYKFSWEQTLSFEGETGPYVQYTHARCCSLIEKAGEFNKDLIDFSKLNEDVVFTLVKLMSDFTNILQVAAEKYEPSMLSRYLVDVAQTFNKFYNELPILVEDEELKASRIAIAKATSFIIKKGLSLLGINAPSKM